MLNEILIKALREHGYKVTPQRIAVYEALAGTDEHPRAETIYKLVHLKHPDMSFATVYKVLDVLKAVGVVRALDFGEGSSRFDAVMAPHQHAQCVQCGRVVDLFDLHDEHLLQEAEVKSGMKLTGKDVRFIGVCQACS